MDDNKYITSYGIVLYTISKNIISYSVGLTRDTIAFREFIRGRIAQKEMIRYLKFMSLDELERLKLYYKYGISYFDKIWEDIWVNKNTKMYNTCKEQAKEMFKFNMDKYKNDILSTTYSYKEWIFPKGRRNQKETEKECAVRECSEELNININNIKINNNIKPICERYIGHDGKNYQTVYYLAYISYIPKNNYTYTKNYLRNKYISGEISHIQWGDYKYIYNILSERKKQVLTYFNNQITLNVPNKINRPWSV